jgi:alanyl-tRNA synthetase
MTERLYYRDSTLKQFTAAVLEQKPIQDKHGVLLDRTAFYPTSGGQMHDTGTLNGQAVHDVILEDAEIWHLVSAPLQTDRVNGELNWSRRFDFMQQHTGFHLLAGAFKRVLGIETIASHLGEEWDTIDIDSDELPAEQLQAVETAANEVIWQNRDVRIRMVTRDEMAALNVRKVSDLGDPIRLIDIEDWDLDPCGGTHVTQTGEVGLVKIYGREKVRSSLRYTFVAGHRALAKHQQQFAVLQELGSLLSTGQDQLTASVHKLQQENRDLRKQQDQFRQSRLDQAIADCLLEIEQEGRVSEFFPDFDLKTLQGLAGTLLKQSECTCYLFGDQVFVFASNRESVHPALAVLKSLTVVKGGGRDDFVQGRVETDIEMPEILGAFAEKM